MINDHSPEVLAAPVEKIPKVCDNSVSCVWKPQCRYVHPEDGDVMPVKNTRRQSTAKLCYYPENCPRGGPGVCSFLHPPTTNQGFTRTDVSQPPPGYRQHQTQQMFRGTIEVQQRGSVMVKNPNMHNAADCLNLREILGKLSL